MKSQQGPELDIHLVKERLELHECPGLFLDNTNLSKTPSGGVGQLLVYTRDSEEIKNYCWMLGVISQLHPQHTVICKLKYINKSLIPTTSLIDSLLQQ